MQGQILEQLIWANMPRIKSNPVYDGWFDSKQEFDEMYPDPIIVEVVQKPLRKKKKNCKYGANCRKKGCRFNHK